MEERLPLYQNGGQAGVLLRREEGLHTVFAADCPGGAGVRKVWLRGEGGASLLLGTLTPENGRWRLTRRVARSSLERQGLAGAVWGEGLPGEQTPQSPQNQRPPEPPKPRDRMPITPKDPVIAGALSGETRGRWQREGAAWRLTLPWQVGQPFPLIPLFCFARVGRGEVSFLLGEQGYPVFQEE